MPVVMATMYTLRRTEGFSRPNTKEQRSTATGVDAFKTWMKATLINMYAALPYQSWGLESGVKTTGQGAIEGKRSRPPGRVRARRGPQSGRSEHLAVTRHAMIGIVAWQAAGRTGSKVADNRRH